MQSRGPAAGATENYYPAPTRVRLQCQKSCLGTDGRLGIVVLHYHLLARRVEPLWGAARTWARWGGDVVLRMSLARRRLPMINLRVTDVDGLLDYLLPGEEKMVRLGDYPDWDQWPQPLQARRLTYLR